MFKQKAVALYVGLALFLFEVDANAAASDAKGNLKKMIMGSESAITIGFAILAFWKWIEFLSGFKPDSALKDAVTPALLTFMAFSWQTVLGWVGII